MNSAKTPIAMTMGDPSGIGPKITLSAWQALSKSIPFFVIGDLTYLSTLGFEQGVSVREIENPSEVSSEALCVMPVDLAERPRPGQIQPANAAGTIEMIKQAVALAQSGQACAVVTNPITKKVLVDGAEFQFPGHTEFLAHLDDKDRSVMMLASPELKVVPVTIHVALSKVFEALTPDLIESTIRITRESLVSDFGISSPRLAIAGLNPHAGEGGLMGTEELHLLQPILKKLKAEGIDVSEPMSADTMFHSAARNSYDAAVCMYHDQALIPIKTLDFDRGVNVTLGLSFVRTSPDHGTAYGIADQNTANPSSLIEAVKTAWSMSQMRGTS